MATAVGIILAFMVILIIYGAAQIAFALIIATVIYLCWCSIWENLKAWAKKYDS